MKEVITFSKDKRAISIMIGYILLVTGAVVMGAIVYQWWKSWVPKEVIDCPDGVSLFASESTCTEFSGNYQLKLKIRNNGRFNVGGYFIRATTSPEQELAATDLSNNIVSGGSNLSNAVIFQGWYNNFLEPEKEILSVFNISQEIYSVEAVPIRFQVHENKKVLASCSGAKFVEKIKCGLAEEDCTPDCSGKDCGDDGCGGSCGSCDSGFKCDGGSCVEDLCGNGAWVADGEVCDDGNKVSGDGCSNNCEIESGYKCTNEPSVCVQE